MIGATFVVLKLTDGLFKLIFGAVFTVVAGLISLRGISSRLGENHRIVKMALKFPGARRVCGF
jgi:hypothetical protein